MSEPYLSTQGCCGTIALLLYHHIILQSLEPLLQIWKTGGDALTHRFPCPTGRQHLRWLTELCCNPLPDHLSRSGDGRRWRRRWLRNWYRWWRILWRCLRLLWCSTSSHCINDVYQLRQLDGIQELQFFNGLLTEFQRDGWCTNLRGRRPRR